MPPRLNFLYLLLFMGLLSVLKANDLSGFDDSILYNMNWLGNDVEQTDENVEEEMIVTSHDNEKYRCTIPHIVDKEEQKRIDEAAGPGPSPGELLIPLFLMTQCSFRLENYWSYELCHGKFLKQYHEERDGKAIKSQEYILGKWNESLTDKMLAEFKEKEGEKAKISHIKVENNKLPAVEIEMVDGTECDLNGQPRTAKIFYVCDANGKNEVYSLKEVTTCNYEVIILTQILCSHPLFKPKEQTENPINCYPVENAAKKPKALLKMEAERLKTKYQRAGDIKRSFSQDRKTYAVVKVDPKDGFVKMEIFETAKEAEEAMKELNAELTEGTKKTIGDLLKSKDLPNTLAADKKPVNDFLSGKYCLSGGSGYWRYELCYGRYVRQFHIDKDGERSIVLGKFNLEKHVEWIRENPHKKPTALGVRSELSYLYTGGSVCDLTGNPRHTEVKLRCLEKSSSMASVSLYLEEPRSCEYKLTVESPIICDILESADEHGLVDLSRGLLRDQRSDREEDSDE